MNDQLLGPLVESWLKDSDSPPSDVGRSTAQIESRLPRTRQWSRWWPVPYLERLSAPATGRTPPGGSSMFSAVKFIAAAVIVALFGGFLLSGVLTTQQDDEVLPASVTDSPSPTTIEETAFPTGTFESEEGGLTLEFRADGTCRRAEVPCTYGVKGRFFSEMTFEEPTGAQVPATYYWDYDGESLTFEPWGVDKRPERKDVYSGHVYRPVGETLPLRVAETDLPIGTWFVSANDGGTQTLLFREDGKYIGSGGADATYAVNEDLLTGMVFHPGPGIELVPATYYWHWDGERLQFRLWGEDSNRWRTAMFLGRVFIRDETQPAPGSERVVLLSHPQLDVWARVEIREGDDGRYEATATNDIDGEPLGEGVGDTLQEAVEAALESLGEPYASDMAESVKG